MRGVGAIKGLANWAWLTGGALLILAAPVLVHAMASPRLIRIDGKLMDRPVVLSNWSENEDLIHAMTDVATVAASRLTGRACVAFTLYWDPKWNEYVNSGKPLEALTPAQGDQHGCFYPAVGDSAAVFLYSADDKGSHGNSARIRGLARWVSQEGLGVLAKHGIPIRTDR
jgi:hypothetical protein